MRRKRKRAMGAGEHRRRTARACLCGAACILPVSTN